MSSGTSHPGRAQSHSLGAIKGSLRVRDTPENNHTIAPESADNDGLRGAVQGMNTGLGTRRDPASIRWSIRQLNSLVTLVCPLQPADRQPWSRAYK